MMMSVRKFYVSTQYLYVPCVISNQYTMGVLSKFATSMIVANVTVLLQSCSQ